MTLKNSPISCSMMSFCAATRWGNTFEEVAQLYAEQVFSTDDVTAGLAGYTDCNGVAAVSAAVAHRP